MLIDGIYRHVCRIRQFLPFSYRSIGRGIDAVDVDSVASAIIAAGREESRALTVRETVSGQRILNRNSSGAQQFTSRYNLFGSVRSSSGGAVSDYRFTAQRQESRPKDVKLFFPTP